MISAGIDIGSTTTKAVIFDDVKILTSSVISSGIAPDTLGGSHSAQKNT
jgi:activator of 2-hydroxyglutaryl-CoA dehydratase